MAETLMPWRTALNVALVVNECALNAVKYAFSDVHAPRLAVSLAEYPREAGFCVLSISNNGNKLPDDAEDRKSTAMGFKLVLALIAQINGTVEIERTPETRFVVRFPETLHQTR